jgi:hypothetical protein
MENQLIDFPVRTEAELHPNVLALIDDENPAMVGMKFACWLAPNCQRALFIVVLPDNNSRDAPRLTSRIITVTCCSRFGYCNLTPVPPSARIERNGTG